LISKDIEDIQDGDINEEVVNLDIRDDNRETAIANIGYSDVYTGNKSTGNVSSKVKENYTILNKETSNINLDKKVITNLIMSRNENENDLERKKDQFHSSDNEIKTTSNVNEKKDFKIEYSDLRMFHVIVSIILSVQQKDEMTRKVINHLLETHKDFSVK